MSMVRGVLVGTLGLAFTQAVVSNATATNNLSGLIGLAAKGFSSLVDVSKPLIPDLRKNGQTPYFDWSS